MLDKIDLTTNALAWKVKTMDRWELSRYVVEDVVDILEGTQFLLLSRKDANDDYGEFQQLLQQKKRKEKWGDYLKNIQGGLLLSTHDDFLSPLHQELKLGISWANFQKRFVNGGGRFFVSFDGTKEKLTFSWKDMINFPAKFVLLDQPFDSTRPFGHLFRFKMDIQYAHHVSLQFAAEYNVGARKIWGDFGGDICEYNSFIKM